MVNLTSGRGVMSHMFKEYGPFVGEILTRMTGTLVSMETGIATAWALNQESLVIGRELGDRDCIATSLYSLGLVAFLRGEFDDTHSNITFRYSVSLPLLWRALSR